MSDYPIEIVVGHGCSAAVLDVLNGAARWTVEHADCLDVLRGLPDASIDSIVCDPPAGISFMGRAWDSDRGGRAQWVEWFQLRSAEMLRVLKPGGHALIWTLPRTSHWTGWAVESAGFEIRDSICHFFGTGFPKSLNISKAIDKAAGVQRPVIGVQRLWGNAALRTADKGGTYSGCHSSIGAPPIDVEVTGPATDDAKRWEGWGSGLKPAHEEYIMARKPTHLEDEIQCLSISLARLVVACSRSSPSGSAPGCDSARPPAEQRSATSVASYEATATSLSGSMGDMTSNIVSSWLDTLAALSEAASTFITAMRSSLTIDLRTLRFSVSRITPESIALALMSPSGATSYVEHVARAFDALRVKCAATRLPTATENASPGVRSRSTEAGEFRPDESGRPTGHGSESWILARKPMAGGIVANVLEHGTGGVNIDGCRVATDWSDRSESWKRSGHAADPEADKIAAPPGIGVTCHPLGRWPANVVLSHSPGCVEVGSRRVHSVNGGIGGQRLGFSGLAGLHAHGVGVLGYADPDNTEEVLAWACADGCPVAELDRQAGRGYRFGDGSNASRFFYTSKPATSEAEAGCESLPLRSPAECVDREADTAGMESPSAGAGRRTGRRNYHPTRKSITLMRYFCRLITPPGGVVLDPFAGSGTTGCAAVLEGFRFIGVELEPSEGSALDYVAIARARIAYWERVGAAPVKRQRAPVEDVRQLDWIAMQNRGPYD